MGITDQARRFDAALTRWAARAGIPLLRVSLGVVFLWFGVLKFFPGLSPADEIARRTIDRLSLGLIPDGAALPMLATWESLIGVGLIVGGVLLRPVILLLLVQMAGTVTPLFLFPGEVFTRAPYAPSLEGQYIVKNLVLISAALVIGSTVRGGGLVADRPSPRAVLRRDDGPQTGQVSH